MIPRRFFWLFDVFALFLAFAGAYWLVPYLGPVVQTGLRAKSLLGILDLPQSWNGQLPPLSETLWIFLVMTLAALVVMGLSGSHGSLLKQSLTRIVILNLMAVFAGLSMVTLIVFAVKSSTSSLSFSFFFTVLCAL